MKLETSLKILLATLLTATLIASCSNKGDDDDDPVANDDDVTTNDDDDVTTNDDDDDMTDDDDDVTSDDDDDDTSDPCGDGYCLDDEDCAACPADCGDCTDPANGCADGTTEQTFDSTMVGCAAKVQWYGSPPVCGAGWDVCDSADWTARRGGVAPTYQYWTASHLLYDGDDGACSASLTAGYSCSKPDSMLVCADYVDSLGNECNWIGCGLDGTSANDHFGGCNNRTGAGALCCLDATPPVAGDGNCDVRELSNLDECAPGCGDGTCGEAEDCGGCPADCGECCGNGVCDEGAENCVSCPDDCGSCCGDGTCGVNDSCRTCEADCGVCPDPASPCADGTVEQAFSGSMGGCSGIVTYDNRDILCGPDYTACTAQQWMDKFGVTAPTHNYWTADPLKYSGDGTDDCSVSPDTGSGCGELTPMRVCVDGGADPEGNQCNWYNCGYETNEPKLYFGGCSGNTTAGTLCCPK